MHPAGLPCDELLAACDVTTTRRGGPGGQHRNKVETAVVIRHRPTGVVAEASERRSQAENRSVAVRRLRVALAVSVRTPPADARSSAWAQRVRAGRLSVARDHADYPTLVAEALDQLAASDWRLADAAPRLGITTSQLVALFRRSTAVWQAVNGLRRRAGLPRLE